jgi:hypothetical protein
VGIISGGSHGWGMERGGVEGSVGGMVGIISGGSHGWGMERGGVEGSVGGMMGVVGNNECEIIDRMFS